MTGTIPARLDRPVLVFGGSGQVGRELVPALHALGTVIAPTHAEADLARPEMLRDVIRRLRPSVIINAAALTNVDHAEREPDLARQLNEVAPGVMADEARHIDAPLVHYSTDYVFDGVRSTPYEETDEPNPINAYGASKLAGERRVAAANGPHLIIRTSWVYSRTGAGFVATILRQLSSAAELRVVADQTGSPTWSRSLAAATTATLRALVRGDTLHLPEESRGIYHLGGAGVASRVDIANELIAAVAESSPGIRLPVVVPFAAADFVAAAPRPRYSALANGRAEHQFGVRLAPWQAEVRRMIAGAH